MENRYTFITKLLETKLKRYIGEHILESKIFLNIEFNDFISV